MKQLGLIGFPIEHSKSPAIFKDFFETQHSPIVGLGSSREEKNQQWDYKLFPLEHAVDLGKLLHQNPKIIGLNVTIPHKVAVMEWLDYISVESQAIQSVNTVCVIPEDQTQAFREYLSRAMGIEVVEHSRKPAGVLGTRSAFTNRNENLPGLQHNTEALAHGEKILANGGDLPPMDGAALQTSDYILPAGKTLWGFNSDIFGFETTLKNFPIHDISIGVIMGDGGSAKTVKFAFKKAGIPFITVSRKAGNETTRSWDELRELMPSLPEKTVFVNTTPLGMWPNINQKPPLPLELIPKHCGLIDLIYNPEQTMMMQHFEALDLPAVNGAEMLHNQALKSWNLFQAAAFFQK